MTEFDICPGKDATRGAILEAAQRLISRFGPLKTSVADIARELHMSPANIYNFYPSRDAIFDAAAEAKLAALKAAVDAEMEQVEDPWCMICILFLTTARFLRTALQNEKDVLQLQAVHYEKRWAFITNLERFLRERLQSALRRGIEQGSLRAADPTAAAAALFDCMIGALDPIIIARFVRVDREPGLVAQLDLLKYAFRPASADV